MLLRYECSATTTEPARVATLIDHFPYSGLITVRAKICPDTWSPNGSFININYVDDNNPSNSFSFNSTVVNFPDCTPASGGGQAMIVSGKGKTIGENFNGAATLSNIQFLQGTIIGTVTCSIIINANGHTFELPRCFNSLIEINPC